MSWKVALYAFGASMILGPIMLETIRSRRPRWARLVGPVMLVWPLVVVAPYLAAFYANPDHGSGSLAASIPLMACLTAVPFVLFGLMALAELLLHPAVPSANARRRGYMGPGGVVATCVSVSDRGALWDTAEGRVLEAIKQRDGTHIARHFWRVPTKHTTPEEALAWVSNIGPHYHRPNIEL